MSRLLPRNLTRMPRIWSGTGLLASSAASIAILGPSGAVASVIFLPVILGLMAQSGGSSYSKWVQSREKSREDLMRWLSMFLGEVGHPTVALVVELDDFRRLEELHEPAIV
ncbi:MAG: hypothetical protein AAGL89_17375, partial [Pseudomonadota bacterium]